MTPAHGTTDEGDFVAFLLAAMEAARIRNGSQLAEMAGLNPSIVNRWINRKSLPSMDALRAIAEPLGVPMRTLVIRAGYMTPEEMGLASVPPMPTGRHTIEDEIRADPRIRDDRKEVLIELLNTLREERSGTRTSVRTDRSA